MKKESLYVSPQCEEIRIALQGVIAASGDEINAQDYDYEQLI